MNRAKCLCLASLLIFSEQALAQYSKGTGNAKKTTVRPERAAVSADNIAPTRQPYGRIDPATETTIEEQREAVQRYDDEADLYKGYIEAVGIQNISVFSADARDRRIYGSDRVYSVRMYHAFDGQNYCIVLWPTHERHLDFTREEVEQHIGGRLRIIPIDNICLPAGGTGNCGLAAFWRGVQIVDPLQGESEANSDEALGWMQNYKSMHPSNLWGTAIDPNVLMTMRRLELEEPDTYEGFRVYHGKDEFGVRNTVFLPVRRRNGRSAYEPALVQNYTSDCPQNCESMDQLKIISIPKRAAKRVQE
jgi:hypothetical protein